MNKPNNKTKSKLDAVLSEINRALGFAEQPWTVADGKAVANAGNFHSDYLQDKGYSIYQFLTASENGIGVQEPIFSGRLPIGPAIAAAQAFLNGLTFKR